MTKLIAALTKEQGVTFVVVLMKDHVVENQADADGQIEYFANYFRCPLVVLVGERSSRIVGNRKDIVDFISKTPRNRLPWREYQIAA